MSGTKNPYDPVEFYTQWLSQTKQLQDDFQKGFDRMTQQSNDISKMTQAWQNFSDQVDTMSKAGGEGVQQFANAMRGAMAPWKTPEYISVPNMLTGWAAFKTAIGSNGRISIPEAERSALGLAEGDLVQVIVLPVSKKKEVKQ